MKLSLDTGIESRVSRPKPSATWAFKWKWRANNQSVDNSHEVRVSASFAADMDEQGSPEGTDLPNNISVKCDDKSFRLTREAANLLAHALGEALDWDGT